MTFTADQYYQIAQGYEKAAADPMVPSEKHADLLKKAEWFRFLAHREEATHGLGRREGSPFPASFNAEPKSPTRSWRAMAPFLTMLWITGAAVYLIGTVLFMNAVNLFGRQETAPEITQPVESIPNVASVQRNRTAVEGNPQPVTAGYRPHAISPDQPTSELPTLIAPSTQMTQEEVPAAPSEPVQDAVQVQSTEMLIVTSEAAIRNGPSKKAKKIGSATAGAELQVKRREKEFVQFIDPSSGNTGWIQSSLLAPVSRSAAEGLDPSQRAEAPAAKTAKSKLSHKNRSAPAQVSPRPRAYADLPADEEFRTLRRRGAGSLSKRRMLREGLMSPDFLPPH